MSNNESEKLKNALQQKDIEYIKETLNELKKSVSSLSCKITSLSSVEQRVKTLETIRYEDRSELEDLKKKTKNVDIVERIVFGLVGIILTTIAGAIAGLVLILN